MNHARLNHLIRFDGDSISTNDNSAKQLFVPNDDSAIDISLQLYVHTIATLLPAPLTANLTTISATTKAQMTLCVLNLKSLFLLRDEGNSEIIMATHASLLLPFNKDNSAITMATHTSLLLPFDQDSSAIMIATQASLLLPFYQNDPAIMTTTSTNAQNLLLPSVQERPAITMTVNTRNLLPFFV